MAKTKTKTKKITQTAPIVVSPVLPPQTVEQSIRLDIGCGTNKAVGHLGVDQIAFPGVDVVLDVAARHPDGYPPGHPLTASNLDAANYANLHFRAWPWADDSVDEIHCSHFAEHLHPAERVHFVNEAYRVLKLGGKMTVVTPHCFAARAYGDLTHVWSPVSEWWFFYLRDDWRKQNAPHNDFYACNFHVTAGFTLRPDLIPRVTEVQQDAMQREVEAKQDTVATFVKEPRL